MGAGERDVADFFRAYFTQRESDATGLVMVQPSSLWALVECSPEAAAGLLRAVTLAAPTAARPLVTRSPQRQRRALMPAERRWGRSKQRQGSGEGSPLAGLEHQGCKLW